ncbi:MAG: chemotaxis protein CheW [Myxococcota bacterium]
MSKATRGDASAGHGGRDSADEVTQEEHAGHESLLQFRVQDVWLAVSPASVEEIVDLAQLTAVPRAPDYLRGLLNLRGHAIPVIDLAAFLGLRRREDAEGSGGDEGVHERIVVVAANDMRVGLVSDRVRGVLEVPRSSMRGARVAQGRRLQEFAVAEFEHGGRLTVQLALAALLDAARLRR